MVVKADRVAGPWRWEREGGIPSYEAAVDVGLAKAIVRGGFNHSVDFSFSDEYKLDHAFCVPLSFVRPEADLPLAPILCNVMAPPVPPARRFFEVGTRLRKIIEAYPEDLRVGVVCTGHLSLEIGGPTGSGNSAPDPEFDDAAVDLIGRGDVDGVLREFTPERMMRAGNYTAGVLNFVALMGLAEARPAGHAECVHSDILSVPFFAWDLDGGS
ncbi:MAG: extradiol ring-cleavage dioxygenase [Dehalococcoidia bacterium]|nr:extradiol ring-cleavage dioxygenase [Dehalococcoidia bacterium]